MFIIPFLLNESTIIIPGRIDRHSGDNIIMYLNSKHKFRNIKQKRIKLNTYTCAIEGLTLTAVCNNKISPHFKIVRRDHFKIRYPRLTPNQMYDN